MILMSIQAGAKTFYITDIANGASYLGQWYDPWVIDSTDISWGGGAYASLSLGAVSVATQLTNGAGDALKDIQTYREWVVDVKWTDYNLATVTDIFNGIANVRDKGYDSFELKFKELDFRNDTYNLLSPAPNLIIEGTVTGEYYGDFDNNTPITATTENYTVSFALGSTYVTPLGNYSIIDDVNVVVYNTTKAATLTETTDYTIDYASGVLTVNDTANVDDRDAITVDYTYSKYLSGAVVLSGGVFYQNTKTDGGHSVSPPTAPWAVVSDATVFSDGRTYPIAFGVLSDLDVSTSAPYGSKGKYVKPLLLNQTQYLYWSSYGEVLKVFDDGVSVGFTKRSDNIFQLDNRPVGEITMFVDGDSGISAGSLTGLDRKLTTTTYRQDTAPTTADYNLIVGDTWYDTNDLNKQYWWNGQQWELVTDQRVTDGLTTEGYPTTLYGGITLPNNATAGLNIGSSYLGYNVDGTAGGWKSYMDSSGNFYLNGTNGYLSWNRGTDTLTIKGDVLIGNPSTVRTDINVADGATNNGTTVDTSGNIVAAISLSSSGKIQAGKTTYGSGTGWLLEYNGGTPRLDVGGVSRYLRWDGSNIRISGIQISSDGTDSTATRLTIIGGTAPSSGLTTSTRLSFTPTEDGQTHFYVWNGSNGWTEIASIGQSTVGSDTVTGYFIGTTGQVGALGTTDTKYGVYGFSSSTGTGVYGNSTSGRGGDFIGSTYGVRGNSTSGTAGVYGQGGTAYGVYAHSQKTALHTYTQDLADPITNSDVAHISFLKTNHTGVPSHSVTNPSLIVNTSGDLYYNVGGGTTWTKIN